MVAAVDVLSDLAASAWDSVWEGLVSEGIVSYYAGTCCC